MGLIDYYMTCLYAYLDYYVVFSMSALAYFYTILCYYSHEKTPMGGDNVVCEGQEEGREPVIGRLCEC